MKVLCTNTSFFYRRRSRYGYSMAQYECCLTVGKWYTVIGTTERCYIVVNDAGKRRTYKKSRFDTQPSTVQIVLEGMNK